MSAQIITPPPVQVFGTMVQGSPAWIQARAGIATASRFKDILTKPQKKDERWSKTALAYAYEVAGEIITGEPNPVIETFDMRRGKDMEPQIRADYEFMTGSSVVEVGFIRRGRTGYSPDGLVGSDGAIEIKTHKPHILIPMILAGDLPPEHQAQTQGGLWVSDRDWVDLVCYWPKLPPFVHRTYRDPAFIATLAQVADDFTELVDQVVDQIRHYGEFGALPMAAE